MPRKTAGYKFPHVTTQAKPHNHQYCPVVGAIAARAMQGQEEWGTLHRMPSVPDEETAKAIRTGFYAARYCKELAKTAGEPVSIQSNIDDDHGAFSAWVRVWPRSVARAEIARRVADGETLSYNVMKKGA